MKKFINIITATRVYVNYKTMWPYIKPCWFRALLAVLLCIPIGSIDALIALCLKPYMDVVVLDNTGLSPWYIPVLIVMFAVVQGGLNYIVTYLNAWVGSKITNNLKLDLYKKFLQFETEFFDKRTSGDVLRAFNSDADAACSGLLNTLKMFISRVVSSIALIGVLFYNSWQLAIIAVVILIVAFVPLTNMRKKIKNLTEQSINVGAQILTTYNESFSGNKTIISYNLAEKQVKNFNQILNDTFRLRIKMTQKIGWLTPSMHIIVSIGIALAIGYGGYLITSGQITNGNFVSFIAALLMLYTPIKGLGNNYNAIIFAFMAIERIDELLKTKSKIQDKLEAKELKGLNDSICFKNVCFEYIQNKPVLQNINLIVKKGETIALVGNSGGGKTSFVNLLPRFYDVNSGDILIDGISIKDYSLKSLRHNIAVVFQDNFLFAGTIRENILLGKENASDDELQRAITLAYLKEFVDGLKDGLDTQIGERGVLLSGGQKQRVAIARAFLKDAPIIILDEATSALDNKAESIVQKAIDNLMKDKTVFVIAHRLSTIKNANTIAVINQGKIVESGNHDELIQINNGHYQTLYNMQFKK